jgi:2-iminoacetate synthase ThiH
LYTDIPHIEVDWRSVGLKVSQLALRFGADDLGAVAQMRNEPNTTVTEEGIRRVIRDAGFVPKKRLARYGALAVL